MTAVPDVVLEGFLTVVLGQVLRVLENGEEAWVFKAHIGTLRE